MAFSWDIGLSALIRSRDDTRPDTIPVGVRPAGDNPLIAEGCIRIIAARAMSGLGQMERGGKSGNRGMAQPGSASALGAEGRGFESLCPDQSGFRLDLKLAPVAQPDRAPDF